MLLRRNTDMVRSNAIIETGNMTMGSDSQMRPFKRLYGSNDKPQYYF
jgi:hypothetical protein